MFSLSYILYIGELELSVPSEDEDEDDDDSAVEAEDEQEEEERPSSELEEEIEAPIILRTFAALEKRRPQMQPASQPGSLQTSTPAEDDSETGMWYRRYCTAFEADLVRRA